MIKKLRAKFMVVFMCIMLLLAMALSGAIYFREKNALEYDCMMYLLNINNLGNRIGDDEASLQGYPDFFVLEIDNLTDTAQVVLGDYFLSIPPEDLIALMPGRMEETGVLEEYSLRYYNGVREEGDHRIVFMDVSYISDALRGTMRQIVAFAVPSLALMVVAAFFLSKWFSRPAQKAMEEQNRFVAFASHELKTPLSIIQANADLMDRIAPEGEDMDTAVCRDNIRMECGRMSSLIEAMNWLALPRQEEPDAQVDVTKLLREESLRFEVRAFEEGLEMEDDIEEGLVLACDPVRLRTLADVFLDNAVKYAEFGGKISLSARKCGGLSRRSVQICVASTGQEIPKTERENIFQMFYRLNDETKGAGIGLSIAGEIVRAMKGRIWVDYRDGSNCFFLEV